MTKTAVGDMWTHSTSGVGGGTGGREDCNDRVQNATSSVRSLVAAATTLARRNARFLCSLVVPSAEAHVTTARTTDIILMLSMMMMSIIF